MAETVLHYQDKPVFSGISFAMKNFNRRIRFAGHEKFRLFPSPHIDNSPFQLGISAVINIRFINSGPDGASQSPFRIPDVIPEQTQPFAPEAPYKRISSEFFSVIAGNMGVFIMKDRQIPARGMPHTHVISFFRQIRIILGIMDAPDIRHLMFFPDRHGIAELCQPGGILPVHITVQQIKIGTAEGFVAKRPDDHTGMVIIPGKHFRKVAQIPSCLFRIPLGIRQGSRNKGQGQLILHVDPVFIAQLQEILTGRVMGGADIITIGFLKQSHILFDQFFGERSSCPGRDFMAAGSS